MRWDWKIDVKLREASIYIVYVLEGYVTDHDRPKKKTSVDDKQQYQLIKALYSCSSKPVALSTFNCVSNIFHRIKPTPVHS